MKFIDWFADGSVYVVDLALACCGVESGAAVSANAPVRDEIPDGAPIVVFVSGTVTTGLAPVVRDTVGELKRNHPCLLYTSPSPRDRTRSRMPSSA